MSQSIFQQVRVLIDAADYRPLTKVQFARTLGLSPKQRPQLRSALDRLEKDGRLQIGKQGLYQTVTGDRSNPAVERVPRKRRSADKSEPAGPASEEKSKKATAEKGRKRSSGKGSGGTDLPGVLHFPKFSHRHVAFFVADDADELKRVGLDLDGDSLKLAARDTLSGMHGDRVVVRVRKSGRPGRGSKPKAKAKAAGRGRGRGRDRDNDRGDYEAKVIEIVDRRHKRIVGIYQRSGRFHSMQPDSPQLPDTFDLTNALPGVEIGDKVVADFESWDSPAGNPRATMIKVLGSPDDPRVDIIGIIYKYNLPLEFPAEVLAEAKAVPDHVRPQDIGEHREDWRDRPVFTIDPFDAKDFDDAICVTEHDNGSWELAVHIADVSHYVQPGSAIDREARKRGNSTYLIDRVIPMLPERLSNGICSLVPNQDRLTHAAIINFDEKGKIKRARFTQAVICSQRRYSYEEAFERLQLTPEEIQALPDAAEVAMAEHVHRAWKLANMLRVQRFARGSLELDFPETKIILNKKGVPVDVRKVEYDISHQLIEEFMLIANEAVAKTTKDKQAPSLYRIHEDPDPEKLDEYRTLAIDYGYQVGDLTNRTEIQKLMKAIRGTPEEEVLKVGLLKSLKRAAYSADPVGHYGLAKVNYTHFTSPIRRYADLVVHRVLRKQAARGTSDPKHPDRSIETPNQAKLQEIGQHISDTERNSQMAEQDTQRIKLFEYLIHLTEHDNRRRFDALITEVRPMGLFVQLSDFFCKGLVKCEDLPGSDHRYSAAKKTLSSPSPKKTWKAGDKIQVYVVNVDRAQQMVDFAVAG